MRRPQVPKLLRRNRSFRDFWIGQTISFFGDQVSLLGIPLLAVLALDASAGQVALLSAATMAPNLFFSVHFGAWADRVPNRRGLMIAADLGRAVLLASLPAAAALGLLSLAQLFVVALLCGTLTVLADVSYYTVFVSLVDRDEYIEGSALLNGSRAVSFVGGNGIAVILVQLITAPFALLADAVSFLASALFLRRARAEEAPVAEDQGRGISEGIRFILRTPLIRASLLATATLNVFNAAFWALLVVFAVRTLGVSAGALGLVLAIGSLGSVLGTVLTGRFSRRLGLGNALVLAFVLAPAPLLLVPAAGGPHGLVLAMLVVAEFLSGIGVMVLDVGLGALIAALVPDPLRARVSGAYNFVNWGVRPLGALGGGLLATATDLRTTMWVAAIGAIAGVLWLLPSPMPRLRSLPDPVEPAPRAPGS
ncbi:MAG TPA: MFS transporter [Solirubrobacterales bacterium]|nr:MFS transporter [Solirubrobacterales bacterium]